MAVVKIATVFVGDGRVPYLRQAMRGYYDNVVGADDYRIMIDDTGDVDYASDLDGEFPEWQIVHHETRRGLGGAVRSAWEAALATDAQYVWHNEEDMVAIRPVDALAVADVLRGQPHLAQLVLKKEPFEAHVIAAGGEVEMAPTEYDDHACSVGNWIEHRTDGTSQHVFSFNPCLIPRAVIEIVLSGARNTLESGVTEAVLDAGYRLAYYGKRGDAPCIRHIGTQRSQGYKW